jgi:hypothetical protein
MNKATHLICTPHSRVRNPSLYMNEAPSRAPFLTHAEPREKIQETLVEACPLKTGLKKAMGDWCKAQASKHWDRQELVESTEWSSAECLTECLTEESASDVALTAGVFRGGRACEPAAEGTQLVGRADAEVEGASALDEAKLWLARKLLLSKVCADSSVSTMPSPLSSKVGTRRAGSASLQNAGHRGRAHGAVHLVNPHGI